MDVERELRRIAGPDPDRSFERAAAFLSNAPRRGPHRRRWLLATPLALLLIAAVPVPRDEPIGYLLRWRVTNPSASLQRLGALPWGSSVMRFAEIPPANESGTAVLLIVIPDVSESDVRTRQRELARLPGTRAVDVRPLTTRMRRPLGAIAMREWIGLRFGRELSRAEVERRAGAVIESLAPGSVVVKIDAEGGGGKMLVVPPGPAGSATDIFANEDEKLVLMIVQRRSTGPAETIRIELDAAALARMSREERTRHVAAELKRRGIDDVDVVWTDGNLRLRARSTR